MSGTILGEDERSVAGSAEMGNVSFSVEIADNVLTTKDAGTI